MGTKVNLDKFLRDLEAGVHDYTKNGKCSSCGQCCGAILPMTKDELKLIQHVVKRKHITIVTHEKENVDFDLSCPFRDDENHVCKIYDYRPAICKTFICSWSKEKINSNKLKFEFDNRYTTVNLRQIF